MRKPMDRILHFDDDYGNWGTLGEGINAVNVKQSKTVETLIQVDS